MIQSLFSFESYAELTKCPRLVLILIKFKLSRYFCYDIFGLIASYDRVKIVFLKQAFLEFKVCSLIFDLELLLDYTIFVRGRRRFATIGLALSVY